MESANHAEGLSRQAYLSTLWLCAMARRRTIASCLLPLVLFNQIFEVQICTYILIDCVVTTKSWIGSARAQAERSTGNRGRRAAAFGNTSRRSRTTRPTVWSAGSPSRSPWVLQPCWFTTSGNSFVQLFQELYCTYWLFIFFSLIIFLFRLSSFLILILSQFFSLDLSFMIFL